MRLFIKIFLSLFLLGAGSFSVSYADFSMWIDCEGGHPYIQCGEQQSLYFQGVEVLDKYIQPLYVDGNFSTENAIKIEKLKEVVEEKMLDSYEGAFESGEIMYPKIVDQNEYKKYFIYKLTKYYLSNIDIFSTWETKTLGDGFILAQTNDKTTLGYGFSSIFDWSHTSETNPFIWDEGCELLFEALYASSGVDKEEVWQSLSETEQKECIKENNYKNISITKVDENFFVINKQYYEWAVRMLYDKEANKLYSDLGVSLDEVIALEKGKSGVFLQHRGGRGNEGGVLFIDSTDESIKVLFENTEVGSSSADFKQLISFELLINKQVKFTYKGQGGKILQQIISID